MRIVHNMMAMNASQQVKKNSGKTEKQLQGLASGLRINMAADDAAGLAVSEKMRALITGMGQAERNSRDGISLIQVGEGALQEVHTMLNRVKELSGQSANGLYQDNTDREAMQAELDQILHEIDRISAKTNFNKIPLFQDKGPQFETTTGEFNVRSYLESAGSMPLSEMLKNTKDGEFNIIYTATTDFNTTQTGSGTTNAALDTMGIRNILQTEMLPQVVSQMLRTYPAFSYLSGSSIGIGLDLYSDPGSSVLASVTSSSNGYNYQSYKLSINMAKVGDLTIPANRSALEQTVCHEMMHAFMFEANTNGMLTGLAGDKFPSWYVEGMAQTTSGPGNWMSALGINSGSGTAAITAALSSPANQLGSGSTSSQYGTGYLACMYMGYLAGGGSTVDAPSISAGLSKILLKVTSGNSLDKAISDLTSYANLADFQTKFATDGAAFVQSLLTATGSGAGGVMAGDLTKTDLVSDTALPGVNLFELNTVNDTVKNVYPSDVNVGSGGGVSSPGIGPTPGFGLTYADNIFTVAGAPVASSPDPTAPDPTGRGYFYDITTGILTITKAGTYKISGGTFTDPSGGSLSGRIVLADNIAGTVSLELDGVNIDHTTRGGMAAMDLGKGNKAEIKIADGSANIFKSGSKCAGIQMGIGTDLTIEDGGANTGKLEAYGGIAGAGIGAAKSIGGSLGNIVIKSGDIRAIGGTGGGAGIGASEGSSVGNITINGGTIYAESMEHGAGIGGGWSPTTNGDITITGGTITAKGIMHGTGIGAGCSGTSGKILISGGIIDAQGGNSGAGIGASWNGHCDDIAISGGTVKASGGATGAGIGAGSSGDCKKITISGGIIEASGGTNGAGIGCGVSAIGGAIDITGGTVTALGGLTNGGGNIGSYTDRNHLNSSGTTINGSVTIKAGAAGEGLYNTNGAKDGAGNPIYSYPLPFDPTRLPVANITSVGAASGTALTWPAGTAHAPADTDKAFIWMNGENQKVTITYNDGTQEVLDLIFYPDAGVWRLPGEPVPPAAIPPNNPSNPVVPPIPPIPPVDPPAEGGIILQIGPEYEDTLEVPVFYFSLKALNAENWSVATQEEARRTYMAAEGAINRVSEMRGTYGALQNRLEHNINNLSAMQINMTEAESRIRDSDMAKMMLDFTRNQIQGQASQAMLAQANQLPQGILQLLQ